MSSPSESMDIERFQQQVASITDQLEAVWTGGDAWSSPRLGAIPTDERNQAVEEVLNQVYEDATTKAGASLGSRDEMRAAAREVQSALQTPLIRSMICRALARITGKSSREVAIEITKACLPVALAGQLAMPASPLVWGLLGFTAACVGTTLLCGDESSPDGRPTPTDS